MPRCRLLVAVVAALIAPGCGGGAAVPVDGPAAAEAAPADAATAAAADGPGPAADAGPEAAPRPGNVTEQEQPGADWSCGAPESCRADYDAFPGRAAAYARPIDETELNAQLWDMLVGNAPEYTAPLAPAALRDALLDAMNARFLIDGLDARPLLVGVTARAETADAFELTLLFDDPWVGRFKGILLLPKGAGPFPGLVAIHGHGDQAAIYRDDYHGREWPGRGYAILMLTMRVMGIDLDEHEVTHDLLRQGFDLMALRMYESLLGLKYLRWHPAVDPARVGLIGHSGGSSTGNLTVRVDLGVPAFVSDNTVDWFQSSVTELYHCETAPGLYPFHLLVNDFTTSTVPVKSVPYGYTNGMDEIFTFMDQHLQ
ncbi:MAG TPA: hypothetical protein VGQ83_19060 [Polyangia bacterium]|jgi:hypothetical protein